MAATDSPYRQPLRRVMPTLFVAGPAKSGSTFLWECMHASFHPESVCASPSSRLWTDAHCGNRPFVLPAIAGEVESAGCLRFQKESAFWRYWGRRKQYSWRRYGGPSLPLARWELAHGTCSPGERAAALWLRSEAGRRDAEVAARGPPEFLGGRIMERYCMAEEECEGRPVAFESATPPHCRARCSPCDLHPGWQDNDGKPCALEPFECDSHACAAARYVPKALRRKGFSRYHARAFALTAFPSWDELATSNVSRARVLTVEGNPGIFQTPPRHARALAALSTDAGRRQLRFVVGWRDPFDLAFSLWSFLSSIGQEGKRVEERLGASLDALVGCDAQLGAHPALLLDLSAAELQRYRMCLDARTVSRRHFYVYGGLYALHLLSWLKLGFSGEQFLFVRMDALPTDAASAARLQAALARFAGLGSLAAASAHGPGAQPARGEAASAPCLSATMTTRKQHRLRSHNYSTVAAVKAAFKQSTTAAELRRFLNGHEAVLRQLLERERVLVYQREA